MAKWFNPLFEKFGKTIDAALGNGEFHVHVRHLQESGSLSLELASYLLQVTLWIDEAEKMVELLSNNGVSTILTEDEQFPVELREIADRPAILYCYGEVDLLQSLEKITLVGTREPSLWGKLKAKQMAYEAAFCGLVTLSGLAQGIDSLIFTETLQNGGKTIAVLPQLTQEVLQSSTQNVLFISEYPPSESPISKWQFIARNRLLAAFSSVTVVVEAPLRSGTLITAQLALDYGKSVYVVLPDPHEECSYGGQSFGIQQTTGIFVQSLYDVFYLEGKNELLEKYKMLVSHLAKEKIVIKKNDNRHLSHADLKRYLYTSSKGDLSTFETFVVELHRFGIIRERKNKIVFNFSGYNSWPKI